MKQYMFTWESIRGCYTKGHYSFWSNSDSSVVILKFISSSKGGSLWWFYSTYEYSWAEQHLKIRWHQLACGTYRSGIILQIIGLCKLLVLILEIKLFGNTTIFFSHLFKGKEFSWLPVCFPGKQNPYKKGSYLKS